MSQKDNLASTLLSVIARKSNINIHDKKVGDGKIECL